MTNQPPCPNYEAWMGYLETRKEKKYPMTKYALYTLLVNRLLKLRSESHDIGTMLNDAAIKGWNTVYPSKDSFIQPVLPKKIDDYKRHGKVIGMKELADRLKQQGFLKKKA